MAPLPSEAAKILVTLRQDGATFLLFSRKRAEGEASHGRLELLGGRLEDEPPLEGLVRELREEEASGLLADKVEQCQPTARRLTLPGALYHVFRLTISPEEYRKLAPSEDESLGFELVAADRLTQSSLKSQLTRRTSQTLKRLGLVD